MCRNIKTLFNFDPAASDQEVRASALQFVRKLSGSTKASKANEEARGARLILQKGSAISRTLRPRAGRPNAQCNQY